eukprot:TRINITY_DN3304_c0_g6_i1.p3 TRINITY_DN3304_c0_g6~~TRINITY_DN3304_c0_g6_i1.p3  ORF type:complete len:107 (-),score=5.64 TRINITY_DN3304_c0_g6_i1:251-571(-)
MNEECGICREPISSEHATLICPHQFCFECIFEWSKVHNSCPFCKTKFTSIRKVSVGILSISSFLSDLCFIFCHFALFLSSIFFLMSPAAFSNGRHPSARQGPTSCL